MTISITTVFTNNRSQAVRLPAEARLPDEVKKVIVRIRGRERIITPSKNLLSEKTCNAQVLARYQHCHLRPQAQTQGSARNFQYECQSHGDFEYYLV